MAYLNAISLSVNARSQENTERPHNIVCRKYNLVVLLPYAVRPVTAIVTKAITIIRRCMCCCNTDTHLMHCMAAYNHSNGIDSIPCQPIHSKRPYNTALSVYRHAAGEKVQSAVATLLLSTAWASTECCCDTTTVDSLGKYRVLLRHYYCRQLGKANFYGNFMYCWPCISIYSCKENPTWCTTYSKYISSTSTCFGRI